MSVGAEQLKRDLIERVVERVHQRMDRNRAALAERFVRQFYAQTPPDDLLHADSDNLYGAALAVFGFAHQRAAGKASVRVYNPELEEHGYHSAHTVVEIVNDDMPFLVDSVTAHLANNAGQVHLMIHPIIRVERDAAGNLMDVAAAEQTADTEGGDAAKVDSTAAAAGTLQRESVMHLEITEQPDDKLDAIREGIERVLGDVRAAVRDWRPMQEKLGTIIARLESDPPKLDDTELNTGIDFLKWLADDNFTFLGYREYSFEGQGRDATARIAPDSGLGVLTEPGVRVFEGLRELGTLPPEVQAFVQQPVLLRVTKANRRATVHRPVHMDTIAIKRFDANGNVLGEQLFVGLFTSAAYSRSPRDIPLLARKVDRVLARSGLRPDSHDGKALQNILETFPRDELFQADEADLYRICMGILHLQERQRVALFVRRDPFERFVSALIYVPRDRHDTNLRLRFQKILAESFQGTIAAFYTYMTDAALARVHLIIKTTPGQIPEVDTNLLEHRLADEARSWADHLRDALIDERGEEKGIAATRRFAEGFPVGYTEHFSPHTAVADIARLEEALATNDLAMNLYRPIEASEDELRLKTYHVGGPIPLSDILPMLENMGIKVIAEHPYEIRPTDGSSRAWIHDFGMRAADGRPIDLSAVKANFHEAFARVWRGEMEDDGFNRLVLLAGLAARQVIVVRTYCKYLRQAAIPFSQSYMESTLAENPELTRLLVRLFETRFDPDFDGDRAAASEDIVGAITTELEAVDSLDQDRILRRYLNAIESTLRTNFYQRTDDGGEKSYVSIKIASENVEELPLPKPFREIFVYSPRVEAVHLRFGLVARGGLRWSDRREDFRTEVLSLVKAQQVKNAVIVPVGSKGGFVLKRPPAPSAGKQAMKDEGVACYKTFIRAMLDVTDNNVAGEVVPPERVVRWDDPDPYLVVAADKGTATFSDYANAVSQEYGFWLDDAFASGGSQGYDHKAMAITARGAWESVKRHFRELGKDIQSEDFTAVGCGDMGGDVFGNGMLLSRHIRLIGAFNHLHVFIDPNPDAETSYAERKRLFDAVKGWDQYDPQKISKGGGVFDRRAKSVEVTPEMKDALDISADTLTPNELIRALLKAPTELLWFGGIGTYVKASDETNPEVGDRGNDSIRVDGDTVGAKVIGEGANLGMTQRGRIEFALADGRINTDSIDNSGGVDCSDHEVNIKILLGAVEEAGDMTRKQRNDVLRVMTDEVADLVLRDNYLQTQAISVTEKLGAHLMDRNARFMHVLERQGKLNRAIEFLPDDETILERRKAGIGLTRPEIAILMNYAKLTLFADLLDSSLPDDPYMAADLRKYFPRKLQDEYPEAVAHHRLRRQIIATQVANSVINRGGLAFVHEIREKTGMPAAEVCRAYAVARDVFRMREMWSAIEALDNQVPSDVQYSMLTECGRVLERTTTWFLHNLAQPIDINAAIDAYAEGVHVVADNLDSLMSAADARHLGQMEQGYREQGVPTDLAHWTACLRLLPPALDIVRIASKVEGDVFSVARTYFTVGSRFGFDWLRRAANQLPTDDAWDKLAVTAIIDDFYSHQSNVTYNVIAQAGNGGGDGVVETWANARPTVVNRTEALLTELRSAGSPDLAMLAVANRQLKALVGA
jgi:glutamate dehydrogenase